MRLGRGNTERYVTTSACRYRYARVLHTSGVLTYLGGERVLTIVPLDPDPVA